MAIAFRHRDDAGPAQSPRTGLSVHRELSASLMAQLQSRSVAEIEARFAEGHRAYLATMFDEAAAWGWVATTAATIGEVNASFALTSTDRYLWNFVTLSAFRGRGIYPRLLDAIVVAESVEAARFWIAYAPENRASGSGILKAGFTPVAELSFDSIGRPVVRDIRDGGGSAASRLLGIPEVTGAVAQCWRCARGSQFSESSCASGSCFCDYQLATKPCQEESR